MIERRNWGLAAGSGPMGDPCARAARVLMGPTRAAGAPDNQDRQPCSERDKAQFEAGGELD